jgi:predicted glycosyltransferase
VNKITKSDCEVLVLCDQKCNENYKGISPFTEDNSNIILKVIEDVKPDVIHIQFEPVLYG